MSFTKDTIEGNDAAVTSNAQPAKEIQSNGNAKSQIPPPKTSLDTSSTVTNNTADPTAEFVGDVDTDNTIPSQALLRKVADFQVLDQDGKSRPFRSNGCEESPCDLRKAFLLRSTLLLPPSVPCQHFSHANIRRRTAKHTSKHYPKI
jgi:hypothetical protein